MDLSSFILLDVGEKAAFKEYARLGLAILQNLFYFVFTLVSFRSN